MFRQPQFDSYWSSFFGRDQEQYLRFAFTNLPEHQLSELIERLLASQQ